MIAGDVLLARNGEVATVTLFNPERLNALNAAMWQRLGDIFVALDDDDTLRCVVVRGEGGVFAAGGDLVEMHELRATPEGALAYHATVEHALQAIEACRHPVLAAIDGPCVGGGLEIACACDLRIASTSARFGAPINKLGFSMYPGELAGLLRLAGPAVVKEILLEGRLLTASEAYAKGLLTRVVADADLARETQATVERIAAGAPLVARTHKQWIARLQNGATPSTDELRASFGILDSADYAEGYAAFRAKRTPSFSGH
jgi:enoyl-CoA hydratase